MTFERLVQFEGQDFAAFAIRFDRHFAGVLFVNLCGSADVGQARREIVDDADIVNIEVTGVLEVDREGNRVAWSSLIAIRQFYDSHVALGFSLILHANRLLYLKLSGDLRCVGCCRCDDRELISSPCDRILHLFGDLDAILAMEDARRFNVTPFVPFVHFAILAGNLHTLVLHWRRGTLHAIHTISSFETRQGSVVDILLRGVSGLQVSNSDVVLRTNRFVNFDVSHKPGHCSHRTESRCVDGNSIGRCCSKLTGMVCERGHGVFGVEATAIGMHRRGQITVTTVENVFIGKQIGQRGRSNRFHLISWEAFVSRFEARVGLREDWFARA